MKRAIAFLIAVLSVSAMFAENKIELIGPFSKEGLAGVLEEKGIRVIDNGQPLCEIWFRKAVPVGAAKAEAAVVYPQLKESTFLGVITFPSAAKDYRGLMIQPGTYGLRYALQPADGNHMGTAPNRDFLVLTPLDAENDPSATPPFEQLMIAADKASGGSHPWSLSLVPPGGAETPKVTTNDAGHLILVWKLSTADGSALPLALVVKGVSEGL
ncbi:MAG TPA: hypothetical protein VLR94_02165 [Acidobacteriota bacterium]|nr:hypothetical protein [Acidobacteriota bacterium]